MILKIKRHSNDQAWWILDDIRKISISRQLEATRKEIESEHAEIILLDNLNSACESTSDYLFPFMRLICRRTDYTEFAIVFDTVAYLCNDQGQTIEKIAV